jgi:hypothetical protein
MRLWRRYRIFITWEAVAVGCAVIAWLSGR